MHFLHPNVLCESAAVCSVSYVTQHQFPVCAHQYASRLYMLPHLLSWGRIGQL